MTRPRRPLPNPALMIRQPALERAVATKPPLTFIGRQQLAALPPEKA